jgi:hypothetical protein
LKNYFQQNIDVSHEVERLEKQKDKISNELKSLEMAILKDPKTNKSVRISLCNKEKVLTFYKLF